MKMLSVVGCVFLTITTIVSAVSVPAPLFMFPLNGSLTDISGNGYTAYYMGTTAGDGFINDATRGVVYQQPTATQIGGLVTNALLPLVYTNSIWVYVFQFSSDQNQNPQFLFGSYINNQSGDATASVFVYNNISNPVINIFVGNLASSNEILAVGINQNQWTHITTTFDAAGNKSIYINGQVQLANETSTSVFLSSWQSSSKSNISIGYFCTNVSACLPNSLYGRMQYAGYWTSALTPAQVAQVYTNQLPYVNPTPASSSSSSSSNTGVIIGAVLGGVGAVLLLGGVVYAYNRNKKTGTPSSGRSRSSSRKAKSRIQLMPSSRTK